MPLGRPVDDATLQPRQERCSRADCTLGNGMVPHIQAAHTASKEKSNFPAIANHATTEKHTEFNGSQQGHGLDTCCSSGCALAA